MAIVKDIENLRDFPSSASKEFREQLERARASAEKFIGAKLPEPPQQKGVDRSAELTPVARPTIAQKLLVFRHDCLMRRGNGATINLAERAPFVKIKTTFSRLCTRSESSKTGISLKARRDNLFGSI